VNDLANGLRAQPVLEVSEPGPVTVDSNHGLHVEVRIPEPVDSDSCVDDTVALFSTRWDERGCGPRGSSASGGPSTSTANWLLSGERDLIGDCAAGAI
jgi:hypothetical protein